ncbi:MAG: hypothetical protein ABI333_00185 [bacterium]
MQVGAKKVGPVVAGALLAALSLSCPETPSTSPDLDSHVVPPDCLEGERRCVVNMMDTCVGGHFGTITFCSDYCDPEEGCVGAMENLDSYIWIANTGEGTLSKVNTRNAEEVARYLTCSYSDQSCDPSRTSVNLHGDVVVTNRGCDLCSTRIPASSVTKFAANIVDCVDRDGSGHIDTSTGADDVKAWGEDECMLWSTELPYEADFDSDPHGARATAWDGQDDEATGLGGSVWVGTCDKSGYSRPVRLYKLNGDTGAVEERVQIDGATCAYGGAVDRARGFWFIDLNGKTITGLDMVTLEHDTRETSCGYGITVDSQGRVWTGGFDFADQDQSCVARYDPQTGVEETVSIPWDPVTQRDPPWLRGIAVGVATSTGSVWAVETSGALYQIDEETLEVTAAAALEGSRETIGVAVDYLGFVWMVDMATESAYKYDPTTFQKLQVRIGSSPYTYSDMTGVQLRNAVIVR